MSEIQTKENLQSTNQTHLSRIFILRKHIY